MSDCCKAPTTKANGRTLCPRCGAVGRPVADETVAAILRPEHGLDLPAAPRRFCRTQECNVLYYGLDGRTVGKAAASVRVGLKETEDPVPLCYCFEFTRADIEREVAERGDSTIPARITAEIRAGRCSCELKNPSGACCLGEVNQAVKNAKIARRSPTSSRALPPRLPTKAR